MRKLGIVKPHQRVMCERCKKEIPSDLAHSEDGAMDFPWCKNCLDYVDGIIIEREKPK